MLNRRVPPRRPIYTHEIQGMTDPEANSPAMNMQQGIQKGETGKQGRGDSPEQFQTQARQTLEDLKSQE